MTLRPYGVHGSGSVFSIRCLWVCQVCPILNRVSITSCSRVKSSEFLHLSDLFNNLCVTQFVVLLSRRLSFYTIALLYYVERFFLHFTLSTKKFNEGACENNAILGNLLIRRILSMHELLKS